MSRIGTGLRGAAPTLDVLLLTSLLWLLAKLLRYGFPPLFETFRAELAVTNATLGLAFSGMMLVYAVMQFPAGALGDRLGPVPIITGGGVVAAVGGLLLGMGVALTVGVPGLVAAMLLVGLGTGVHKTVSLTVLARVYDRQGRAVGLLDTFGTMGGVAAPLLVVGLLARPDSKWELLYLAGGVAGIGLAIAFWARVRPRLDRSTEGRDLTDSSPTIAIGSVGSYLDDLARPRILGFAVVAVLFSFSYNGVVAFLPSYAMAEAGMTTAGAGLLYAAFFGVSLIQPLSGAAADRWDPLVVSSATLAVAAGGLVLLLLTSSAVPAVLGALAVGVGSHGFRPVRGAHLVDIAGGRTAGGTVGAVRTALMAAGAIAPGVVGWLAVAGGFRVAFAPLAVTVIIAAVGALGMALRQRF